MCKESRISLNSAASLKFARGLGLGSGWFLERIRRLAGVHFTYEELSPLVMYMPQMRQRLKGFLGTPHRVLRWCSMQNWQHSDKQVVGGRRKGEEPKVIRNIGHRFHWRAVTTACHRKWKFKIWTRWRSPHVFFYSLQFYCLNYKSIHKCTCPFWCEMKLHHQFWLYNQDVSC